MAIILKRHAGIMFLCLLFLTAGLLRLNDLSLYTPDSSRYLIWGNSIAHGKGFLDDTQPDPDRLVVHAPLYSVLIAPIEVLFPLSLTAVKIWTLLWGVAALALFYYWMKIRTDAFTSLVASIALAVNPLLLLYSTEALSEAPFVVFLLMIIILSERFNTAESVPRSVFWTLLLCCMMIPLIREVGIAAVVAVVIFLFSKRAWTKGTLILFASSGMMLLWYLRNHYGIHIPAGAQNGNVELLFQHFVTPEGSSLVAEFVQRMWLNLKEYFFQIGGMIIFPVFSTHQVHLIVDPSWLFSFFQFFFEFAKFIVVLCCIPFFIFGLLVDVRTSPSSVMRALMLFGYIAIILAYPIHDIRFLMPLIPILLYYIVHGSVYCFTTYAREGLFHRRRLLPVIAACVIAIPNLVVIQQIIATNREYVSSPLDLYKRLKSDAAYPPLFTQPWTLLGAWIKENLPANSIIATPSKEIAIVVGTQKVLELDPGMTLPLFERLIRENGVDYVLAPVRWSDVHVYEFLMTESRRYSFESIHRVANLELFHIRSRNADPDIPLQSFEHSPDSLSASFFLRKGRTQLLQGYYDSAAYTLQKAVDLAPLQPEVVYQLMLANAFRGDSVRTRELFHRLVTLPQAGSYLFLARVHTAAMNVVRSAIQSTSHEEKVVSLLDASRQYWDLGYPHRAYELIRYGIQTDTTYFNALLWGFHFAWQMGDRIQAQHYLTLLRGIDAVNPIVQVFGRVIGLSDSLKMVGSPEQQSRIHMTIAELYKQIDLKEEAIDEAERANNSPRQNAMMFLAGMYETKSRLRIAELYYRRVYENDSLNLQARDKADSLHARWRQF